MRNPLAQIHFGIQLFISLQTDFYQDIKSGFEFKNHLKGTFL